MAGYEPKDMEDTKIGGESDVKLGERTQKLFSEYNACIASKLEKMMKSPYMSEWCARYKAFIGEFNLYGFNSYIELDNAIKSSFTSLTASPESPIKSTNPLKWYGDEDEEVVEIPFSHERRITASGALGVCLKNLCDKVNEQILPDAFQTYRSLKDFIDFPMHNHCMPGYQLPLGVDNFGADLV